MLPSCSKWWYAGYCTTNWLSGLLYFSVSLCFFLLFVCLFISISLVPCVFLRPESSGDSAAFLSTSRSSSGYTLLAAAVWSKRRPAIGQQTRPHPSRHCSPARTRTPPRAPRTVSTQPLKVQFYYKNFLSCLLKLSLHPHSII